MKKLFGKMITHIPSALVADAPLNEIISPFATGADNASVGEDTTKQLSVMQVKPKKQAAYNKVSCRFSPHKRNTFLLFIDYINNLLL